MEYKNALFLFFVAVTFYSYGQNGTITGTVFDKISQEPIPYANVILKTNNVIVTGGITNENGNFNVNNIAFGNYSFEIQFIGYKSKVTPVTINKTSKKLNLGSIYIEEDAVALESVEVIAERSSIEQKIDRKVINVGKDLTTAGASASDIMGNIPSVSVNQDGEISFRGNENVRILVDGKPTNISPSELLQQIPSTSIKTIELITNPSAKYNPEGMSGIINITLKKNASLGFNASLNTGVTFGKRTRYNNSLNLNYRVGKTNFYGSYGNRLGKSVTDGLITRTRERTSQQIESIGDRTSHVFKFGMDYFMNDKNTLSFYTNQNVFDAVLDATRNIVFFDNANANFNQFDLSHRDNINASYNADFKHNFTKAGHNIELEVDYNTLKSDTNNDFDFNGNTPLANYDELVDDTRTNTTINLDYINPISESATLEIGLETRLRRTDNTYISTREDFNNSDFRYDRNIHSFYTTFSQTISKWQYNIGIRLEDYNVDTQFNEVSEPQFDFSDKLFNIYPSGFLKYTPGEESNNSYQLSFSRRIDRPSLNQINPIRQLSTPQIIITGNPSLVPQFTNSFELNYTRKLRNGSFTVGGFYRRINDEINRRGFFDEDNPTLLIIDYDNFESNNAYGFEFSSNYRPTNWWSLNGSFDVYTRTQKGVIENENVQVNNTLLNAKLNNSFKATKTLTFQIFTFYSGPQKILQYELKENFFMNLGARYNFAGGKGTLSINFNDVFRSQRFAFKTYRTIFQEGEFRRDSRTLYAGMAYRFGSGKNKSVKRKKRDKNEKADKLL
ncbi:outer membrane beta-barrel family protein [Flagellimonas pacifica]|uniref:Outer membrane receptor for ferrienterochelin and colicins n=1 Tax=Flagellimonas pacifica TaxID=1247520 RepID=A0A285MCR6_9FLAO|nr:outer membrane beta-barrel family protein [Allomuricauda parva]SNY94950.1 Outer membrane receptor for ferrienterochelin and colicins [Allomuricauda parva]